MLPETRSVAESPEPLSEQGEEGKIIFQHIDPKQFGEIIARLPEPPTKIKEGIQAFYQRIDPQHMVSIAIDGERLFGWKDLPLHQEATARFSWQDLRNFREEKFKPATVLGTLLDFGCAALDEATGHITITETVPEDKENRKAKQDIVNYILAHKDPDGFWVVGGVRRSRTSDMVFLIGGKT